MPKLEYKIIQAEGNKALPELESLVNRALSEGWEPQGGVMISEANIGGISFTTCLQAMIRRSE
ncbi:MAG TPA: DUF1737 domain-containing protein [Desulfuromonadales bacterium]|nr:DUF1737 domain-containing protein [Desulfuromonadales bacterium]